MHQIINTLHSYNRYLILIALIYVLYRSWSGWQGRKAFTAADGQASLILMILADLQLLLGLVQYFVTSTIVQSAMSNMGAAMKEPWLRYFAVEHAFMMVIAIAFIHIGRSTSKKAVDSTTQHKKLAIWTSAALLLVVATLAMKGLLFSSLATVNGTL